MHWIVADLLMFVASVVLYLAIRKAALNKLSPQFNNLASFTTPLFIFVVLAMFTHPSFHISVGDAWLLLFAGIFFAYFAAKVSMMSIDQAPNPGYSLVISKSYVVFTSVLSVPLFGAALPASAILAILMIVGFAALIMIDRKHAHRAKSGAWIPLAFGAFLGWGFLVLVAKHLFLQGLSPLAFLIYIEAIVLPCILIEMRLKRISFKPITQHLGSFVFIGVAAAAFNFFNFTAIKIAPNAGYVNATNAASIAAVTILSTLLFRDEFSWRKMIGVLGVIAGLLILFLAG